MQQRNPMFAVATQAVGPLAHTGTARQQAAASSTVCAQAQDDLSAILCNLLQF
jgi:hypothetical protein